MRQCVLKGTDYYIFSGPHVWGQNILRTKREGIKIRGKFAQEQTVCMGAIIQVTEPAVVTGQSRSWLWRPCSLNERRRRGGQTTALYSHGRKAAQRLCRMMMQREITSRRKLAGGREGGAASKGGQGHFQARGRRDWENTYTPTGASGAQEALCRDL